jgi:predicted O-methyltransferase YrrM
MLSVPATVPQATQEDVPSLSSYAADYFSQHIPLSARLLACYRVRPRLRFLEVGSYEGRSAVWLLSNILTHPTSRLYCVDTFR